MLKKISKKVSGTRKGDKRGTYNTGHKKSYMKLLRDW